MFENENIIQKLKLTIITIDFLFLSLLIVCRNCLLDFFTLLFYTLNSIPSILFGSVKLYFHKKHISSNSREQVKITISFQKVTIRLKLELISFFKLSVF